MRVSRLAFSSCIDAGRNDREKSVGSTYSNAVSLAVDIADLASMETVILGLLGRVERDRRSRSSRSRRAGLGGGSSQDGKEAGQNNGETHRD